MLPSAICVITGLKFHEAAPPRKSNHEALAARFLGEKSITKKMQYRVVSITLKKRREIALRFLKTSKRTENHGKFPKNILKR